jgi:hypothetical protein
VFCLQRGQFGGLAVSGAVFKSLKWYHMEEKDMTWATPESGTQGGRALPILRNNLVAGALQRTKVLFQEPASSL